MRRNKKRDKGKGRRGGNSCDGEAGGREGQEEQSNEGVAREWKGSGKGSGRRVKEEWKRSGRKVKEE